MEGDKKQNSKSIEKLAKILNKSLTNTMPTNIEQNATLWNNYARDWSIDKPWVQNMIKDNLQQDNDHLILGEEWSDAKSFAQVIVSIINFSKLIFRMISSNLLSITLLKSWKSVSVAVELLILLLLCVRISTLSISLRKCLRKPNLHSNIDQMSRKLFDVLICIVTY